MSHTSVTIRSEAVFSVCGNYQFWLCREWGVACGFGVFLLCNPSRADALWGDQTAMRCNNLAVHWGWRGFGIVNIYPVIDPNLSRAITLPTPAPIQHENDEWLKKARRIADFFVVATGAQCHRRAVAEIRRVGLSGPFHAIRENAEEGLLHPSTPFDERSFPAPVPVTI